MNSGSDTEMGKREQNSRRRKGSQKSSFLPENSLIKCLMYIGRQVFLILQTVLGAFSASAALFLTARRLRHHYVPKHVTSARATGRDQMK